MAEEHGAPVVEIVAGPLYTIWRLPGIPLMGALAPPLQLAEEYVPGLPVTPLAHRFHPLRPPELITTLPLLKPCPATFSTTGPESTTICPLLLKFRLLMS